MSIKLKFIVILFLIFSLIFPSFSAVSVSDGSAFVSKAELSAYLTDLDNEINNINNSLDSRIDEIVSTYLGQKGIWNGETQTILYKTHSLGAYVNSVEKKKYWWASGAEVSANTAYKSFYNAESSQPLASIGYLKIYNDQHATELAKITKTGMAFIKVKWEKNTTNSSMYLTANTGPFGFYVYSYLGFNTDGVNHDYFANSTNNISYNFSWGNTPFSINSYIETSKNETVYIFVNKGETLRFYCSSNCGYTNVGFNNGTIIGWDVTIEDITVY